MFYIKFFGYKKLLGKTCPKIAQRASKANKDKLISKRAPHAVPTQGFGNSENITKCPNFLHVNHNAHDAKAIAIPWVLFENSPANNMFIPGHIIKGHCDSLL